jgi:cell division protein FtsL
VEEGGMTRLAGSSLVATAVAALLGSLSFVAWRQARAIEALEHLDDLRREVTLGEAEETDLLREVHFLESRGRVVPEAESRLGMRLPEAGEIIILPGEDS